MTTSFRLYCVCLPFYYNVRVLILRSYNEFTGMVAFVKCLGFNKDRFMVVVRSVITFLDTIWSIPWGRGVFFTFIGFVRIPFSCLDLRSVLDWSTIWCPDIIIGFIVPWPYFIRVSVYIVLTLGSLFRFMDVGWLETDSSVFVRDPFPVG